MKLKISTARADFLAANPKVRELQDSSVRDFNRLHDDVCKNVQSMGKLEIDTINQMRRAGEHLNNIAGTLSGKQITFDFHLQLAGAGETQLHCDYATIAKYQFVARSLTADITTVAEAQQFKQIFLHFYGVKSSRPQQNRIPPKDAWNKISWWLDGFDIAAEIKSLKENPNYFLDGKLRPEVREWFDEQWIEKFKALDEFRMELGI